VHEIGAGPVAGGHEIGQHHVERQRLEPAQQPVLRTRAEDHLDILAPQHRAQEGELEVARQRGQRPHAQDLAPGAHRSERRGQVVGGAEDLVGPVECDATGLGQHKAPPPAFEEVVAERELERLDLRGHRRLRDVEPVRGAGERAVARHRPEQPKVMEVERRHSFTRSNIIVHYIYFSSLLPAAI
jgi:hypothetical protein